MTEAWQWIEWQLPIGLAVWLEENGSNIRFVLSTAGTVALLVGAACAEAGAL